MLKHEYNKESNMPYLWLSLIPPLTVLILAFILKKLNQSLIVGIFVGALIATNGCLLKSILLIKNKFVTRFSDTDNIYTLSFLLMIGIIITLMHQTGGAKAFAQSIIKYINNKRSAETFSILLCSFLAIDDYLANLTIGNVMRPITDKFAIPRAKLAFLIHSISTPLVILIPISSWAAMILGQLDQAGISINNTNNTKVMVDPFLAYLYSIPFIFYSVFMILSTWLVVRKRISFGPMSTHEEIAKQSNNLFGNKKPIVQEKKDVNQNDYSLYDFFLPMAILIGSVLIGIPYAGGYSLFGGNNTLLEALKSNDQIFFILFIAGTLTLSTSLLFAIIRKKISLKNISPTVKSGASLMLSPIIMVTLASILSSILRNDLGTGTYLASILTGAISIKLLPLMFFIVSTVTALTTGSSWGTIALIVPIATSVVTSFVSTELPTTIEHVAILIPTLGAIFSGAICGDHISPISETTIMSATSSGSYSIDHTITQLPYALPPFIASIVAFLLAGILIRHNILKL